MANPIALKLAQKQKEISVAEFFERNKHILGFGNPTRAIITSVKEGVDNSLDACEEAGILPDIVVEIKDEDGGEKNEYKIIVEDNGPGIVKKQIPNVFGRLLYGSRFHAIKQSRGQQGIGVSAVVLYGQLTTGKPTRVISKIDEKMPAYVYEIGINTHNNTPEIISQDIMHWEKPSGTRIEINIIGDYVRGKRFVYEYLQSTSIVNPHAQITFVTPEGEKHVFERTAEILPRPSMEIKPHPYGIELGTLMKMAKSTKCRKLSAFLKTEFSSMGERTTNAVCKEAGLDKNINPKMLTREQLLNLLKAFKKVKIMSPPTNCLSPIGETLIRRSLKHETQEISPEFIVTTSRPPSVFSGNPFQVEAGIVYGGNLPKDTPVKILRFANRVPLLYQQGDCVSTAAISSIDWRRYGLEQKGGKGIPVGPAIFLVHVASTHVPFTSESKEAVADIPEIENEIKLAFRECARKMQRHLTKKAKRAKTREKFDLITKILPELARKTSLILNKPVPPLDEVITKIMDVVWIEDSVEYTKKPLSQIVKSNGQTILYEKSKGYVTTSKITIVNYKHKPLTFNLYALKPKEGAIINTNPKPVEIKDYYLKWKIENIKPTERLELSFEMTNLAKEDFEENDLYIENINPEYVIGAEKWEGE
ncbi:MAG: DNA topoisomerase VI subunit B [Thermoplasmata archaeon]|nr:MAG: DNA topoisomerase VI subunit B [Thermoplasmata archaeon]